MYSNTLETTTTEYMLRQTELWERITEELPGKTKRIINDKVLNYIRFDPYNSEPLHCELEGLRSYNKIGNGNRIIFAICEDCRKRGLESVNNCKDCRKIPDTTIMLFAYDGHDIYDWLKRTRGKLWRKAKRKQKIRENSRATLTIRTGTYT